MSRQVPEDKAMPSPSCSVDAGAASKQSLIVTIAFRKQKVESNTKQLQPYVKSIVDRGKVLVDNELKIKKSQSSPSSRMTLGVLPTGKLLVLKNCPMAPPAEDTDTDTDASHYET